MFYSNISCKWLVLKYFLKKIVLYLTIDVAKPINTKNTPIKQKNASKTQAKLINGIILPEQIINYLPCIMHSYSIQSYFNWC